MGQALSIAVREQIMSLRSMGKSFVQISQDLKVPYDTVQKVHKRMTERNSCSPDYTRCGGKGQLRCSYFFYRASLWLKRHHLGWGAPFIRLQLKERYGDKAELPSDRQLQVWFRAAGLNPPRQRHTVEPTKSVKEAHERWQVDAKEQLCLANGQDCCYLSVVDEYTGCALGATLFPPQVY